MSSIMPHRGGLKWLRWILIAAAAILVGYVLWSIWDYDALIGWMQRARPLPFFIAMAVLPAIGMPVTPLFLIVGATFDLPVALLGSALAVAANVTFCYFVGRSGLRRHLVRLFARFDWELPNFEAKGDSTWAALRFATLVKLAPGVPSFVKNYGLGAARVPFGIFFAVAMTASAIYGVAGILFGDALFKHELDRGTIVLLVVAGAALLLRWWFKRQPEPAHA